MALPIAHAAAGYLVHRAAHRGPSRGDPAKVWRHAALFMLVGNLPDFDFLIGFVVGRPGLVHRGVSHSLLAVVVFGALAGWVGRRWRDARFLPNAVAFGAAYASHLLVDWLTMDSRPPLGGQFLWPFSDTYYISPVPIFGEVWLNGTTRAGFISTVLAWPTMLVLAREIAIVLAVVAAWHAAEVLWARFGTGSALRLQQRGEDLV
jgi:membrane-bound metal-dependent hydrolase YbcI (DUF457 family)